MDKYRLLYVLVLSCVTTVLPAQLKDYSSQVDSVLEIHTEFVLLTADKPVTE